jgi:hypothetical protein
VPTDARREEEHDATVTDRVRVAAALLASRIARGRLASPFTAREVYRNDWTGLTGPRVVGEALECLRELGAQRPSMSRCGTYKSLSWNFKPSSRNAGAMSTRSVQCLAPLGCSKRHITAAGIVAGVA